MQALVLEAPPRQRRWRRQPAAPCLVLREVPRPRPPADGWVRLRPTLAGIGAADLARVRGDPWLPLTDGPGDLPMIPGTEVVGFVEEARGTRWAQQGRHVLVDPIAGCLAKGLVPCRRCRVGEVNLCENRDRTPVLVRQPLARGGGWSEGLLAPEDVLVPADGIPDQRGVLAVPLAAAMHAALRWEGQADAVAVIGSGTRTRLLVASLRRLHPDLDIIVLHDARRGTRAGRHRRSRPGHLQSDHSVALAAMEAMGASQVWRGDPEMLFERVAEHLGARRLRSAEPGRHPILDRGIDTVFDCRATAASLELSLHLLRAGGNLVVSGPAARVELDWSLIWSRELSIRGSGEHGRESEGWPTFAVVREWLMDPAFPVDSLVTHRYPLDAAAAALGTAMAGEAAGAVKVVFEGPASPLRERRGDQPEAAADLAEEPVLLAATAARVRQTDVADEPARQSR